MSPPWSTCTTRSYPWYVLSLTAGEESDARHRRHTGAVSGTSDEQHVSALPEQQLRGRGGGGTHMSLAHTGGRLSPDWSCQSLGTTRSGTRSKMCLRGGSRGRQRWYSAGRSRDAGCRPRREGPPATSFWAHGAPRQSSWARADHAQLSSERTLIPLEGPVYVEVFLTAYIPITTSVLEHCVVGNAFMGSPAAKTPLPEPECLGFAPFLWTRRTMTAVCACEENKKLESQRARASQPALHSTGHLFSPGPDQEHRGPSDVELEPVYLVIGRLHTGK